MNSRVWKSIGIAVFAVTGLIGLTAQKTVSSQGNGGRLDGTWEVQTTVRNCDTGAVLAGPFPELVTFMTGGTMIDSLSSIAPANKTPGQGVWSHVTADTYSAKFKVLNFATNSFIGFTIVTQDIVLDANGDAYTAVSRAEIHNNGGSVTICSTAEGTRFE